MTIVNIMFLIHVPVLAFSLSIVRKTFEVVRLHSIHTLLMTTITSLGQIIMDKIPIGQNTLCSNRLKFADLEI